MSLDRRWPLSRGQAGEVVIVIHHGMRALARFDRLGGTKEAALRNKMVSESTLCIMKI